MEPDMSFEEFSKWAINFVQNKQDNVVKHCANAIGIKDTFAYEYDKTNNEMVIYSTRPGLWIGYKGANVDIINKILSEELCFDCKVKFKEVKGRFVTTQGV